MRQGGFVGYRSEESREQSGDRAVTDQALEWASKVKRRSLGGVVGSGTSL